MAFETDRDLRIEIGQLRHRIKLLEMDIEHRRQRGTDEARREAFMEALQVVHTAQTDVLAAAARGDSVFAAKHILEWVEGVIRRKLPQ